MFSKGPLRKSKKDKNYCSVANLAALIRLFFIVFNGYIIILSLSFWKCICINSTVASSYSTIHYRHLSGESPFASVQLSWIDVVARTVIDICSHVFWIIFHVSFAMSSWVCVYNVFCSTVIVLWYILTWGLRLLTGIDKCCYNIQILRDIFFKSMFIVSFICQVWMI